jgi:hypothetical protein
VFHHFSFQATLGVLIILNCLATYNFEKFVISNRSVITWLKRFVWFNVACMLTCGRLSHKTEYRNSYKNVAKQILEEKWPNQYLDRRDSSTA